MLRQADIGHIERGKSHMNDVVEKVRCEYEGSVIYVPKRDFVAVVFNEHYDEKTYIRYSDGARMYDMSLCNFKKTVRDAGAKRKVDGVALVNPRVMNDYIERFKEN